MVVVAMVLVADANGKYLMTRATVVAKGRRKDLPNFGVGERVEGLL